MDVMVQLEKYVVMVQAKQNDYFKQMNFTFADPDTVTADIGRKSARDVKNNNTQRSVHTFVNLKNGDILKSGGWKAPAPNGVRGNIFADDFGANVVNEYGASYLTGPRW